MSAPEPSDPSVAAAEAELVRLRAEAEAAEAQLKAAQARAALAAAEAEAASARAAQSPPAAHPGTPPDPLAETEPVPATAAPTGGPLDADQVDAIAKGYTFEATTLDLGALINGDPVPSAQIRIPLG